MGCMDFFQVRFVRSFLGGTSLWQFYVVIFHSILMKKISLGEIFYIGMYVYIVYILDLGQCGSGP